MAGRASCVMHGTCEQPSTHTLDQVAHMIDVQGSKDLLYESFFLFFSRLANQNPTRFARIFGGRLRYSRCCCCLCACPFRYLLLTTVGDYVEAGQLPKANFIGGGKIDQPY